MSLESWIAVVGTVATLCTTVAFVPQIVKTWRQGGRDLSYGTLLLLLAGALLWFAYGLLTGARAVILANAAVTGLVSFTVGLKWKLESKARGALASRRLRVAIDMDEVLADSLGKFLRVYNETSGARLKAGDIDGRSLEAIVGEAGTASARELVLDPSFFRDLEVIEGSREVVRELAERYEVFVVSAAMEVPTSFAAKYAWLREHFPFIPPSHVVLCGDKAALDVDYLIDDTPRHFERFRGTSILFSAPHNRGETHFLRVEGWADVRRLLLGDGSERARGEGTQGGMPAPALGPAPGSPRQGLGESV